jgi:hypothetical protein
MADLALDVSRLLKRIANEEDAHWTSREYQRIICNEFGRRRAKLAPVAIERWRQRGSIPTGRLLTLLLIAQDRGVPINLLDFAISAKQVEEFRIRDREAVREWRRRKTTPETDERDPRHDPALEAKDP